MSNSDYMTVNYLNCNSLKNTLYFIWGVPIINLIVSSIIILLFILIVYNINSKKNQFILSTCLGISSIFIYHNFIFNQIENIKTDCINYGKTMAGPTAPEF